ALEHREDEPAVVAQERPVLVPTADVDQPEIGLEKRLGGRHVADRQIEMVHDHVGLRRRTGSLVLEAVADKTVEQRHTKSRGPRRIGLAGRGAERYAGDVEMRPRHVADEPGKELRSRDRTGGPAAGSITAAQ